MQNKPISLSEGVSYVESIYNLNWFAIINLQIMESEQDANVDGYLMFDF